MIVVSAGMVKSGSLWYYRMTDDLIIASGKKPESLAPPHSPVEDLHEGDKIKCDKLDFYNMKRILSSSRRGYSYPIKTHSRPTLALAFFGSIFGEIKITYTYRDPRDVVLSVMDHAEKARRDNININIRDIKEIDQAIKFVRIEFEKWKKWKYYSKFFDVNMVKYENLVENTTYEIKRLKKYINLKVKDEEVKEIAKMYSKDKYEQKEKIKNKIHMNKGYSGRFMKEMDIETIKYCQENMKEEIEKMGYTIVDTDKISAHG